MKDYRHYQWWSSSFSPQIDLKIIEVDAKVIFCVLPFLINNNDYTYWGGLISIFFFIALGLIGYPLRVALSKAKLFFTGKKRSVKTNKRSRRSFNNG